MITALVRKSLAEAESRRSLTRPRGEEAIDAALRALRTKWPWMKTLFADSAYDRAGPMEEAVMLEFTVEVMPKI